MFDTFRHKLAIKIDKELGEWTLGEDVLNNKSETERNKIVWRYLHNYRIKDEETGDILKPSEYKARRKQKIAGEKWR